MQISNEEELQGVKKVSELVAHTLKSMIDFAKPGMSCKELDDYGGAILRDHEAISAPKITYKFPGYTCISLNNEIAHGIPHASKVLKDGQLVNIDVSAALEGYYADNGCSFVIGVNNEHQQLVDASRDILMRGLNLIRAGFRISHLGKFIETEAQKQGYTVIRNLAGHGVGRSLHEEPREILNCYDRYNFKRFKKDSVIAVETFISTKSTLALTSSDGWTLVGNKGGYVAQHEHTILVTDEEPIILTKNNGVSN
jgi:methionyl aminopeptidase